MRYIKFLYLKYFLRKLPKTVEICLKKSRPAGYFFVGVYIELTEIKVGLASSRGLPGPLAGVDIFPNVLTFCEGIVLKF